MSGVSYIYILTEFIQGRVDSHYEVSYYCRLGTAGFHIERRHKVSIPKRLVNGIFVGEDFTLIRKKIIS